MSACKHGFRSSLISYFIKEMHNGFRVYIRLCMSSFSFDFLHFPCRFCAFHSLLSVNWLKSSRLNQSIKCGVFLTSQQGRLFTFLCVVRILLSITKKRLLRADPCCRPVIKEFAHAFSCVYIELWMHLGSLESTQKARVALGCASSYSYVFFVLSKLPACIHNSIYAR